MIHFDNTPSTQGGTMRLSFLGGAQTVTGSQHLLSVNGKKVLIECGMFQGRRKDTYEKNQAFAFDPSTIDALALTHAHIDHSGNIPNLVKQGFKGPIYATPPTVDLCKIMLRDSASLQQHDIMWVNRIRAKQHLPPVEPLYAVEDAEACMDQFVPVAYDKVCTIAPDVDVRFLEAGHIMGSAGIHFDIVEGKKKSLLVYAGDIGRPNMPVLHDPNLPRDADILIMESTYGNREHDPVVDAEEELAGILCDTAKNGGKVIIPAFAIGRTQELVYVLHKLYNEDRIPDIPIFVDSPLAVHATKVFRDHPECFDRETFRIFINNGQDPFEFGRLKYVVDVEESKRINSMAFPHVVISASGMAEGGRILHHLRNNIGDHRVMILFVGFAAKETLARKIMDGQPKVKIFGEEHTVRARIKILGTFSAHAGRRDLIDYVQFCPPEKLKHLFLVHGEPDQAGPLKDALRSKGYPNVHYPAPGEVWDSGS
jgi:metallo-beta-lactamase family protein